MIINIGNFVFVLITTFWKQERCVQFLFHTFTQLAIEKVVLFWLIDWLVFSANSSSISAKPILRHTIFTIQEVLCFFMKNLVKDQINFVSMNYEMFPKHTIFEHEFVLVLEKTHSQSEHCIEYTLCSDWTNLEY